MRYDDDRDPALTLQLRAHLRPPADPAYWDGLEARVMAHITAEGGRALRERDGTAWWEPMVEWRRALVAAAVAALVIGAAGAWRASHVEPELAYDVVVESPPAAYGAPQRPAASRGDLLGDLLGY
ncbi:MAG: hypothetical protein MUF21_02840 [Gemmatimonadaceae bacterium]|jgi:hypothetical protein|nr:hypothetical protein [Gemmatimonadaceae bacterium]